jgi:hypothetical protein
LAASLAAVLPSPINAETKKSFFVHDAAAVVPVRAILPAKTVAASPDAQNAASHAPIKSLSVSTLFADAGFPNGFRFSNLGGKSEVFIPVPEGVELNSAELVLMFDDISAHDARRSMEILLNDRSVSAIALDGKSTGRTVRIPLTNAVPHDGLLKLTFYYSGAATQDRCIDVRYVGDSVTIRPDSAVELDIGVAGTPNITATAALMPQDVAIFLSNPQPPAADIATALTLARSVSATGRKVSFYHGVETLPEIVKPEDRHAWIRGLIVVGAFDQLPFRIDTPVATLASTTGMVPMETSLAAVRVGGIPILLVSDAASARAGRLFGNPSLAALRDTPVASVGPVAAPQAQTDRVSFDELGLKPAQAEVYGRSDLLVAIASRSLPSGTRAARVMLEVMVAPDGAGEKAVVSAFVNERLLASTVAAVGEPTRLDFALPDGLVGTVANIRVVVQRRSAQGDCKFEPQGYPAEILGSSAIILSPAGKAAEDFSDLSTLWAKGVEVLVPTSTAARPLTVIGMLADVLDELSKEASPIKVKYVDVGATPTPAGPFIAVNNIAPAGATERIHFDRGRVAVTDRTGRTRLDLGGLTSGAVAQIVTSNSFPGLWIKPLASDGSLPVPPTVNLDRGDVAFLDKTGVALALSTDRDTLLRVSYPDQESWLTAAERYRSWIVGGMWVLLTIVLLFVLQRIYHRRTPTANE